MGLLHDAVAAAAGLAKKWGPARRLLSRVARSIPALRKLYQSSLYMSTRSLELVRENQERMRRLLGGCLEPREGHEDRGVFIIVVDALRWRSTSLAGYERRTTPFLETLPARGRAAAAAPQTYSSVPSILTGLYPHRHGAVVGGRVKNMGRVETLRPLRRNAATLADIASYLGMEFFFVSAITTAALPFYGRLVARDEPARAERILSAGLAAARGAVEKGKGFIAYLHIGDLHQPVRPPKRFRDYFGRVEKLPRIETWDYYRPETWHTEGFERYRRNRVLLYDNALRYVDYALERFFERLRDEGLWGRVLVVVTADHGEEFWEHAEVEARHFYHPYGRYGVDHGHTVFGELVEVPLLFAGPGAERIAGSLEKGAASHVDIVPTVLDWLGVEHRLSLDGYSLLRGPPPPSRPLLSESIGYGYEKKALTLGGAKLFHAPGDGVTWLFDLRSDPGEQTPLDEPAAVEEMLTSLKRLLARGAVAAARQPCGVASR